MKKARLRRIVRQFPENGLKLLLETPANVRELLQLTGTDLVGLIDFERLSRSHTTFVARDFRHLEADVVLQAPVRPASRPGRSVVVYILIEHQSKPDPLMMLRLLEYTVHVYRRQARRRNAGRIATSAPLDPVMPVVLYTGTARWDAPAGMHELVALGEHFQELIPSYRPLFLNVGGLAAKVIEKRGGGLGPVLRLLQQRKARSSEFRTLLARTVQRIEGLADAEQARWRDLLTYIHALVYNQRGPAEQPGLHQLITDSVRTKRRRQESSEMAKTMADVLMEQGAQKGEQRGELRARQQTLLRQLRRRFGELPPQTVAAVESTQDVEQLDEWLDRIVTAETLEEIVISPDS